MVAAIKPDQAKCISLEIDMERKNLRITISGSAGGAIAMAHVIAESLKSVGFDVTLEEDPDDVVIGDLPSSAQMLLQVNPKIVVGQEQTKRATNEDVVARDAIKTLQRAGYVWKSLDGKHFDWYMEKNPPKRKPVAWMYDQLMHDSMGGWERKITTYQPPNYINPEELKNVVPLYDE